MISAHHAQASAVLPARLSSPRPPSLRRRSALLSLHASDNSDPEDHPVADPATAPADAMTDVDALVRGNAHLARTLQDRDDAVRHLSVLADSLHAKLADAEAAARAHRRTARALAAKLASHERVAAEERAALDHELAVLRDRHAKLLAALPGPGPPAPTGGGGGGGGMRSPLLAGRRSLSAPAVPPANVAVPPHTVDRGCQTLPPVPDPRVAKLEAHVAALAAAAAEAESVATENAHEAAGLRAQVDELLAAMETLREQNEGYRLLLEERTVRGEWHVDDWAMHAHATRLSAAVAVEPEVERNGGEEEEDDAYAAALAGGPAINVEVAGETLGSVWPPPDADDDPIIDASDATDLLALAPLRPTTHSLGSELARAAAVSDRDAQIAVLTSEVKALQLYISTILSRLLDPAHRIHSNHASPQSTTASLPSPPLVNRRFPPPPFIKASAAPRSSAGSSTTSLGSAGRGSAGPRAVLRASRALAKASSAAPLPWHAPRPGTPVAELGREMLSAAAVKAATMGEPEPVVVEEVGNDEDVAIPTPDAHADWVRRGIPHPTDVPAWPRASFTLEDDDDGEFDEEEEEIESARAGCVAPSPSPIPAMRPVVAATPAAPPMRRASHRRRTSVSSSASRGYRQQRRSTLLSPTRSLNRAGSRSSQQLDPVSAAVAAGNATSTTTGMEAALRIAAWFSGRRWSDAGSEVDEEEGDGEEDVEVLPVMARPRRFSQSSFSGLYGARDAGGRDPTFHVAETAPQPAPAWRADPAPSRAPVPPVLLHPTTAKPRPPSSVADSAVAPSSPGAVSDTTWRAASSRPASANYDAPVLPPPPDMVAPTPTTPRASGWFGSAIRRLTASSSTASTPTADDDAVRERALDAAIAAATAAAASAAGRRRGSVRGAWDAEPDDDDGDRGYHHHRGGMGTRVRPRLPTPIDEEVDEVVVPVPIVHHHHVGYDDQDDLDAVYGATMQDVGMALAEALEEEEEVPSPPRMEYARMVEEVGPPRLPPRRGSVVEADQGPQRADQGGGGAGKRKEPLLWRLFGGAGGRRRSTSTGG
ncbi:hypothetical protein GGF31_008662 [Allomyces arbusculus]|nr:hypothetical protein GGF31_008662 [Allomyces arbusculus]